MNENVLYGLFCLNVLLLLNERRLGLDSNASLCENNKTYWVGAASGGMFIVGFSGGRGGGCVAILHNIVIGQ